MPEMATPMRRCAAGHVLSSAACTPVSSLLLAQRLDQQQLPTAGQCAVVDKLLDAFTHTVLHTTHIRARVRSGGMQQALGKARTMSDSSVATSCASARCSAVEVAALPATTRAT